MHIFTKIVVCKCFGFGNNQNCCRLVRIMHAFDRRLNMKLAYTENITDYKPRSCHFMELVSESWSND